MRQFTENSTKTTLKNLQREAWVSAPDSSNEEPGEQDKGHMTVSDEMKTLNVKTSEAEGEGNAKPKKGRKIYVIQRFF